MSNSTSGSDNSKEHYILKVPIGNSYTITFPEPPEKLPFELSRDPVSGSLILDFEPGYSFTSPEMEKEEKKGNDGE